MTTPRDIQSLLESEFARHEEFAEAVRARHAPGVGDILIDLAKNSWNLRNVLVLIEVGISDEILRAAVEAQIKSVANQASTFGHALLIGALEKSGPVTKEVIAREQPRWLEEITFLLNHTRETEKVLQEVLKGKR